MSLYDKMWAAVVADPDAIEEEDIVRVCADVADRHYEDLLSDKYHEGWYEGDGHGWDNGYQAGLEAARDDPY